MINEMKKRLSEEADYLIELLETFEFANIKNRGKYISCGRDEESSPKSIVIYLDDNEYCMVTDFARNTHLDIISFICREKGAEFYSVISCIKEILGIDGDFYLNSQRPTAIFGGFFKKLKKKKNEANTKLPKKVLDQYDYAGNERFLADGISLEAQRFFQIGFDKKSQSITIPIHGEDGALIGIKARVNRDVLDGEQKYFYLHPCLMNLTLYGYAENYADIQEADCIYVFEAEKSVMQAYDFGIRNCVALGSSSVSKKQGLMLLSFLNKKIILMFDKGLKEEAVQRNCNFLTRLIPVIHPSIYLWEPSEDVPQKSSPTDLGKERFEKAVREELVLWKEN